MIRDAGRAGVGVPCPPPQFLADQLTYPNQGGQIIIMPTTLVLLPRLLDLPPPLHESRQKIYRKNCATSCRTRDYVNPILGSLSNFRRYVTVKVLSKIDFAIQA